MRFRQGSLPVKVRLKSRTYDQGIFNSLSSLPTKNTGIKEFIFSQSLVRLDNKAKNSHFMFIMPLTVKGNERGSTFLGSCTLKTVSWWTKLRVELRAPWSPQRGKLIHTKDHVVMEEAKSLTQGTMIPSMRKTHALAAKLTNLG